jgi:hypothetical protein
MFILDKGQVRISCCIEIGGSIWVSTRAVGRLLLGTRRQTFWRFCDGGSGRGGKIVSRFGDYAPTDAIGANAGCRLTDQ